MLTYAVNLVDDAYLHSWLRYGTQDSPDDRFFNADVC
jgi:hypothetical protein